MFNILRPLPSTSRSHASQPLSAPRRWHWSWRWHACCGFFISAILACPAQASPSEDIPSLLKEADAYRIPAESVRVEAFVEQYRNEVLNKDRLYTVYIRPGRRSLILMKSPSEAGQKVLMLADQFWLLMPESQRPIRITATQKLIGDASSGDIASMTWSEDYTGESVEEQDCPIAPESAQVKSAPQQGQRCLVLDLKAARNGVTYARTVLYLNRTSKLPIKADLFVSSGKRAKEAWYFPKTVQGRLGIASMVLLDDIQTHQKTIVTYRTITPKVVPDEFFNPATLIRNPMTEW